MDFLVNMNEKVLRAHLEAKRSSLESILTQPTEEPGEGRADMPKSEQVFLEVKNDFKNNICDIKSSKKSSSHAQTEKTRTEADRSQQRKIRIEINSQPQNPMAKDSKRKNSELPLEELLKRFDEYYHILTFLSRQFLIEIFFCFNFLHASLANVNQLARIYRGRYGDFIDCMTVQQKVVLCQPQSTFLESKRDNRRRPAQQRRKPVPFLQSSQKARDPLV